MKIFLCVLFFCLCSSAIRAQTSFNTGGLIRTSVGDPVDAATVFINGSKQVTKTDIKGEFVFINVSPGTYQLVVNMIGYASVKQNVVIQSQSAKLNIILTEKQIVLS